jgi:hypothetical protein
MEVVLAASPATSSTCFVSTVGLKVGGEAETSCLDAGISGVHGGMDFFELLAKEHYFRKSGFSFLALLCLSEAAINGDYAIRSWHL